jgi:hypothetical protein
MPLFLDTHFVSELPLDDIRDFLHAARSATADSLGVLPLEVYCGDEDGLFYLVAAPDESSVRQRHAAYGLICQRVRRVESQRAAMDELGEEEKSLVQQMIAVERSWPAQAAS